MAGPPVPRCTNPSSTFSRLAREARRESAAADAQQRCASLGATESWNCSPSPASRATRVSKCAASRPSGRSWPAHAAAAWCRSNRRRVGNRRRKGSHRSRRRSPPSARRSLSRIRREARRANRRSTLPNPWPTISRRPRSSPRKNNERGASSISSAAWRPRPSQASGFGPARATTNRRKKRRTNQSPKSSPHLRRRRRPRSPSPPPRTPRRPPRP